MLRMQSSVYTYMDIFLAMKATDFIKGVIIGWKIFNPSPRTSLLT
jgi:hypothetical protein